MYFESLSDFINMDGHGVYVWSSYAIALIIMAGSILLPWLSLKRIRKQLRRQIARQVAR